MSQGDANPAAVPHAAEDIQGDDRWMSQVRLLGWGGGSDRQVLTLRSRITRRVCLVMMNQGKKQLCCMT